MEVDSTAGGAGVSGGRVPRGVMSIKIAKDKGVLLGAEKAVDVRVVVWRAGGGRRDVKVVDGKQVRVDIYLDGRMFRGIVVAEGAWGENGVRDGMVDKGEDASSA